MCFLRFWVEFEKKLSKSGLFLLFWIAFEKKWKVNLRELITDTLGNYEAKKTPNGTIGSPKTPTKVERKSEEFFDILLVNFICSITNFGYNGWIYFRVNETNTEGSAFHDEIMICNPNGCIEYIDYHKI